MQDFRKLKVWEKSHDAVLKIYKLTFTLPKEELYGLTSQIRRSAVSIPANIAEGTGNFSSSDINRYFQIALGSLHETEYYLILINDLKYVSEVDIKNIIEIISEVKAMLISLIKKNRIYEDPENYGSDCPEFEN